jgi:hypothetical protein
MLDAVAWRQRAEEYRVMAARSVSGLARQAWLDLAETCEYHACEIELSPPPPPRLPGGLGRSL